MTVNAVRRPRRRAATPPADSIARSPVETLAIGEIDQTVFDCPNCARPLALGARRCPGCRTRLVMGIPLGKASVFASLGLAIGLVSGSVGGFVVAATRTTATSAGGTVLPSSLPVVAVSTPAATAAPVSAAPSSSSGVGLSGDMPAITRSALSQAITVDDRLAAAAGALRTAANTAPFDASDVAQVLRAISADSVYAQELADRVSAWPDSASVGADLAGLYTSIHERAADALVASVRNDAAYRENAKAMLLLLAGVPPVDARVRDLATTYGVAIPLPSTNP